MLLILFFTGALGLAQQPSAGTTNDWPWAKYGICRTENKACVPVAREQDWAIQQHKMIATNFKSPAMQMVLLGDSISHGFQFGDGVKVWNEYYASLNAGAFAVPGDKTENVLWRITEGGELDGISPKVLVILIGINNLYASSQSAEDVAQGITTIVYCAKAKLPHTKILLLGLFPCFIMNSPGTVKGQAANAIVSTLHDGKQVFFLDIGNCFIEQDKTISKGKFKDGIHPNEKGYRIWALTMQPYLEDLLKNDGRGEIWKTRVAGKPGN